MVDRSQTSLTNCFEGQILAHQMPQCRHVGNSMNPHLQSFVVAYAGTLHSHNLDQTSCTRRMGDFYRTLLSGVGTRYNSGAYYPFCLQL